jgi:hypothetical protein
LLLSGENYSTEEYLKNEKILNEDLKGDTSKMTNYYKFKEFIEYKNRLKTGTGKLLLEYVDSLKKMGGTKDVESEMPSSELGNEIALALQHYRISIGEDNRGSYISYYDIWDLNVPSEGNKLTKVGHPFEVYDRIYYNPKTGEILNTN